jgi:MSHA biogenesis protein MshQ
MNTENVHGKSRARKMALVAAGALCLGLFANSARAESLPQVAGYWPFNGSAVDASGGGANGTAAGSTYYATGIYAQAIGMNGGGYVNIANSANFNNMYSFTLAAWVYPTANNGAIISKVTPNRDFVFQVDSSGHLNFHIAINFDTYYHCTSSDVIPLNTWTHVAAVVTPYGIILYKNGVIVATRALNNIKPEWTGTDMAIGRMSSYSYFSGLLEEVRIYSSALSWSQVHELYSPTVQ